MILFVCEDSQINFQSDGTEDLCYFWTFVCLYTYSTLQHLTLITFDIKVSCNIYYIVYNLIYVKV